MSMIQVENLTFSYPGGQDTIFDGTSFQIDTDWRLGFVGRNGRGKTTFLRLLMGEYPYSGRITASVQFDCFPYPVTDRIRWTGDILQEVCPEAEEWELLRELSLLEVDAGVLWRGFDTLSNGEQTKVLLAALFLNRGHFLLIDEPTNHLDQRGRALLSAYLRRKRGFILVSHDRRFLDGCVDHILSLNRADIQVQRGTFSSFLENFQRQQDLEQAQNEKLKGEIRRLEQAVRRTSSWSDKVEQRKYGSRNSGLRPDRGFLGHKSAKMMQRAKNLETRQQSAIQEKSALLKNTERADSLKLTPLSHHSRTLAAFTEVSVYYSGRPVCPPVSFTLEQGERLALTGGNGSGKSSLLQLLLGRPLDHTGQVRLASGLQISYVPQDPSGLQGSLEDFAAEHHLDETRFKTILRKLDFSRGQLEKDMADFSWGQKKKVYLAKSLCEEAHLYLWDEPMNYIDIYSRLQLEQLLTDFSSTMVFVEHDQAFQEAIATRTVALD
ncbi:MAG: ABC-F type ribosomal protection protein [Lawsonibacter sp.]|nr:ABC-F type ribosomal protection protein [Lawsonibacter sp.]